MKNEKNHALRKLNDAVNRLREGCEKAKDDLEVDGAIERFEFTFELLWKCLKVVLEDEGIICKSPMECLKEAFKFELIEDEDIFLAILRDRNKTFHLYSKEEASKIYQRIKVTYLSHIERISQELNERYYVE
jgi:nucleotidyltransferase substrate binding protein (TIGR01987 family)